MRKILLLILAVMGFSTTGWSRTYLISFTNTRYPAPVDFKELLTQKFPLGGQPDCLNSTKENSFDKLWGVDEPATGEPYSKEPSPAFARWYAQCARQMIQADAQAAWNNENQRNRYLDRTGVAILEWEWHRHNPGDTSTHSELYTFAENMSWTWLTPAHKNALVGHLIDTFVGPGVLSEGDYNVLVSQVEKALEISIAANPYGSSVADSLATATFAIALSDAFLMSP